MLPGGGVPMKIAILGAGHMGSWLARALAEKNNKICIYDLDRSKIEKIQKARILGSYEELKDFQPELVINAVSLKNTLEAFKSAEPHLSARCLIADVTSVKSGIAEYYRNCRFRFASVHPMFGPTFANVERLEDENVILISESDREGARFFRKLFGEMRLNIFEYSFEEHDRMIAYSLVLPFASTMVFAACMNNSAVPASTFKKHREIAGGLLSEDDYLLAEILFSPYSLQQLEKVTSRLEFLKHVIKAKDVEEAHKFIRRLRENVL
jgi:prephenate dehydrogenase